MLMDHIHLDPRKRFQCTTIDGMSSVMGVPCSAPRFAIYPTPVSKTAGV